ncbi:MAG: inositol monophosphatase [Acidobacteria bacterium]|nr:MAG: inositol monophosphatase [Acidobacteriota bacterium]
MSRPGAIDPETLMRTACEAVRAGGRALAPFASRSRDLEVEEKALHDLVTAADVASERAIVALIRERHPDHAVLGEEEARAGLDTDRPRWLVDPLDGTANFVHGYPVWGVSVACTVDGRVVAGAILDPNRGELFAAARGLGARLDGERLRTSGRSSLKGALIATGFPFRRLARLEPFLDTLRAVLPAAAGVRRAGAASIDLAWVAAGRCDGFWEEGLGPWDIAAGSLLVEEAGGVVTDFTGGDRFLETGAVVAGPPGVHRELRQIVERCQGAGA